MYLLWIICPFLPPCQWAACNIPTRESVRPPSSAPGQPHMEAQKAEAEASQRKAKCGCGALT